MIDAQGLTVVRTPLAQEMWHKRSYNAFKTDIDWSTPQPPCNPHTCLDPPLAYPCERGTGQGDVPSTLQWNRFYDILLTALDSVKSGRFFTQSTLNHKHLPDNAFADDTLSFAADHDTLQEKANIVSAFSIIFGTDLRADKLRVAHYSYGSEDRSIQKQDSLTVHTQDATHRWHPNPVKIRSDGTWEFLYAHMGHSRHNSTRPKPASRQSSQQYPPDAAALPSR
jgi:hypothetical protein